MHIVRVEPTEEQLVVLWEVGGLSVEPLTLRLCNDATGVPQKVSRGYFMLVMTQRVKHVTAVGITPHSRRCVQYGLGHNEGTFIHGISFVTNAKNLRLAK